MKNKSTIILLCSVVISLGLYNTIVLLLRSSSTTSFWISFAFINFAFVMFFASIAIAKAKTNSSKVVGLSLPTLSSLYASIVFVFGTIIMLIPTASTLLALIPQLVFVAAYMLVFIPAFITYYVGNPKE